MSNKHFVRKLFYIATIAILLIPLFWLGQPTSRQAGQTSGGGELARMRDRYGIGQANLGQIDPASESMRLATLGMRGIAAAWLWQKAEYYKEEKYFDRLSATLNQIALLQPHFVKVWESQAHNLSYNVSHEFDDYRQRYAWVKKGIDYLIRGTKYNERQPILQWNLGWYTNHKIGRSDEKTQFRELYRNDNEFHDHLISEGLSNLRSEALGADRKPDNWLTGRLWFLKAYDLVASGALIRKNEVHFYAEAPWSQMYYGEALQEEGILDDRCRFAWQRANESWHEFGNRDILTSWGDSIQLRSLDRLSQNKASLVAKFNELTAPIKDRVMASIRENMNKDELFVIDKADSDLSLEQLVYKKSVLERYLSEYFEIAQLLPEDQQMEALGLASSIRATDEAINHTVAYRDMCNFNYWDLRSEAEQSPVTLAARKQVYDADQLVAAADLKSAEVLYEKAWLNWNAVFHRYPDMMLESVADDVMNAVDRYFSVTDQIMGDDFVLHDFMVYRKEFNSNRADVRSSEFFQRALLEAEGWKSAMEQPAVPGSDHVPMPVGAPLGIKRIPKNTTPANPSEVAAPSETPATQSPTTEAPQEPTPSAQAAPEQSPSAVPEQPKALETQQSAVSGNSDSVPQGDTAPGRPPRLTVPSDQ